MTIAWLTGALFIIFAILSFIKIRIHQIKNGFIYKWGFIFGAFVWEDLFIFSFYGILASAAMLISQQYKIGLLLFFIFWFVRSTGETIYFFLQQFILPKHSPHYLEEFHFGVLRKMFGPLNDQQCYIFLQVLMQTITMVCIAAIILILLNWNLLP